MDKINIIVFSLLTILNIMAAIRLKNKNSMTGGLLNMFAAGFAFSVVLVLILRILS